MSIFKYLRGFLSNDLYIQVWEDRLKISRLNSSETFDEEPLMALKNNAKGERIVVGIGTKVKGLASNETDNIVNPFKHPRLLVDDFQVAQKILMHGIRELHKSKWFSPSPRIIFHPMEKLDGGVTDIEERVYQELCAGAGAREILLHIGEVLPAYNFDYDKFKRESS